MLFSLILAQICWASGGAGERGFKFPSWQRWAVRLLCLRALHLPLAEEHRFSGKHPPAAARGDRAEPWAQSPCAQGPSHHLCRGAAAACPSPQQACGASSPREWEWESSSCQGVLAWRKAKLSSAAESILPAAPACVGTNSAHRCCPRNPSQIQHWSRDFFFFLAVKHSLVQIKIFV